MMFIAVAAPQGDCALCMRRPVEMDEQKECILSENDEALWYEKFEDTKESSQKS